MLKGFSSPFRRQVARVLCWSGRSAGTWAFQETPNPNVWKFQSDTGVPKSTKSQLLEVPGVQDVLVHEGLSGTWLAITRQSGTEWQVLAPQLKDFLQSLPDIEAEQQVDDSTILDADATEILEVLEHRIRPSVQEDGGDVQLKSWDRSTGEVVLCLQGACRGCPQSAVTLQESILKTLQHFVPDVTSATWMHFFSQHVLDSVCVDIPILAVNIPTSHFYCIIIFLLFQFYNAHAHTIYTYM